MVNSIKKNNKKIENPYVCDFCKKSYKLEKAFINHMCKPKERYINKDQKAERLAFDVFVNVMVENNIGKSRKNPDTAKLFNNFIHSNMYDAFLKFANFIIDYKVNSAKDYIKFLIKKRVKIDYWTRQSYLKEYRTHRMESESPDQAIERSLYVAQKWADDNRKDLKDFFKEVSTFEFILMVENYQISPWFIFTCSTSSELIDRLSEEQIKIIEPYISYSYWLKKIEKRKLELDDHIQLFERVGL